MEKSLTKPWKCPDQVWDDYSKLLPRYTPNPLGGRPPTDPRKVIDGIFYVLGTGTQWKAMPAEFPPPSTCHRYFQHWCRQGFFQRLWEMGLAKYEELKGIDWKKMNIDTSHVKAPLGGEKNRQIPSGS